MCVCFVDECFSMMMNKISMKIIYKTLQSKKADFKHFVAD